ncbi:MAG: hypothetical protein JOZ78_14810 [Chroococcidiopsidaceae cyanobacterium CP_BM_ER_R8_30]|nr:hypothetical protein [Chroococcidiopsidaceae cyanobacterium CP_BM_ER_R8_30]
MRRLQPNTISYLTAPNAEKTQRTYRYMCQLASHELELDRDGIPVPKHFQIVDVVVTEPGEAPVRQLVAARAG